MEYTIKGGNLPCVVCNLDPHDKMVSLPGAMEWMTPTIKMSTETHGGIGRSIGRKFAGDSVFQNVFTAGPQGGDISFAAKFPGTICAFDIMPGKDMILQKSSFLASTHTVYMSGYVIKNVGAGIFGGEGWILQRVSGAGTMFAEFDGHLDQFTLSEHEKIVVSTGHLAAFDASCSVDVTTVGGGVTNVLFGGEGFFHTTVAGPGRVWLHTMPLSKLRSMILVGESKHK